MSPRPDDTVSCRAVVVGSGVAGLSVALGAEEPLVVLTKHDLGGGGASWWAQGGLAVAASAGDSPDLHAADTRAVAGGLAAEDAVEVLTRDAPARLEDLLRLGARFARDRRGRLKLAREAGHSRPRVVHAGGDRTGTEIMRVLAAAASRDPSVRVAEAAVARRLLVAGGRVVGLLTRHSDGRVVCYATGAVVLATGGIGRLYRNTTNPPGSSGEGLALAARAGARLADLEFVQFHPTALDVGVDPMPLLTEALRGAGARLVDSTGERFLARDHPDAELAPRDVVARGVARRLRAGHRVYLDVSAVAGLEERFPAAVATARAHGLDPASPLPVAPAAHYHMGGVAVDLDGRSSLPGLYACGEVARTGAHGANRLASNSLAEALVFGARVAAALRTAPPPPRPADVAAALAGDPTAVAASGEPPPADPPSAVRDVMWEHVGVERDEVGLRACLGSLGGVDTAPPAEDAAAVARLVAEAALARRATRGAHYRSDSSTEAVAVDAHGPARW